MHETRHSADLLMSPETSLIFWGVIVFQIFTMFLLVFNPGERRAGRKQYYNWETMIPVQFFVLLK